MATLPATLGITVLGSDRLQAYAASVGAAGKIYRLDENLDSPVPISIVNLQPASIVSELTNDDTHVFWVERIASSYAIATALSMNPSGSVAGTTVSNYQQISRLVADPTGGCLYFWGQDAAGMGAIRVAPKAP
jgi:hypothetical protein